MPLYRTHVFRGKKFLPFRRHLNTSHPARWKIKSCKKYTSMQCTILQQQNNTSLTEQLFNNLIIRTFLYVDAFATHFNFVANDVCISKKNVRHIVYLLHTPFHSAQCARVSKRATLGCIRQKEYLEILEGNAKCRLYRKS